MEKTKEPKTIKLSESELKEFEELTKKIQKDGLTDRICIEYDELMLRIVGDPKLAVNSRRKGDIIILPVII